MLARLLYAAYRLLALLAVLLGYELLRSRLPIVMWSYFAVAMLALSVVIPFLIISLAAGRRVVGRPGRWRRS